MAKVKGQDTRDKPWELTTPPGTPSFEACRDGEGDGDGDGKVKK